MSDFHQPGPTACVTLDPPRDLDPVVEPHGCDPVGNLGTVDAAEVGDGVSLDAADFEALVVQVGFPDDATYGDDLCALDRRG